MLQLAFLSHALHLIFKTQGEERVCKSYVYQNPQRAARQTGREIKTTTAVKDCAWIELGLWSRMC